MANNRIFHPATNPVTKRKRIPHIPPQVDLADLKDNLSLIAEDQWHELDNKSLPENERIRKADAQLPYGVIHLAHNNTFDGYRNLVVYKGAQQQKALGAGDFGVVKLLNAHANWYTLKNVRLDENDSAAAMATNEHDILKTLKKTTPESLKIRDSKPKPRTLESEQQFPLISIYARGTSLSELVNLNLHPLRRLKLAINALKEIDRLNNINRIVHRDIKPSNFIANPLTGEVVLIDFGYAQKMDANDEYVGLRSGGVLYYPLRWRWDFYDSMISHYQPEQIHHDKKIEGHMGGMVLAEWFLLLDYSKLRFECPRDWLRHLGIVDESHRLFVENTTINREQLKQILDIINGLTIEEKLGKPIRIEDAIKQLEKIYAEYILLPESEQIRNKLTAAEFDIEEYLRLSDVDKIKMLNNFKGVDEVIMIDVIERDDLFYIKLKRELEAATLLVCDDYYVGKEKTSLITSIELDLSRRELPTVRLAQISANPLNPSLSELRPKF